MLPLMVALIALVAVVAIPALAASPSPTPGKGPKEKTPAVEGKGQDRLVFDTKQPKRPPFVFRQRGSKIQVSAGERVISQPLSWMLPDPDIWHELPWLRG